MVEKFEACRIHVAKKLIDAMAAIDRSTTGIALIVDDQDRLVGTLTDGDARRALLWGAALDSPLEPFMHRNFVSVGPLADRAEVLDLMQSRQIPQIPIIDMEGRLLGVHLLREILGSVERPNWAVIMAGGQGTRLRPLTAKVPKPLLKVAGRPILERLLLHLVGFGIRRIFLSVNYLGHLIEEHCGDGSRFGCRIEYLRESRPLGTGGPLSLLPEQPEHPLVVMNGDLVTQANLGAMLDAHGRGGQMATVGVQEYVVTVPYGCVGLEGGRVVRLEEKPHLSQLVLTGIYVLSPELVARVPRNREFSLPALIDDCIVRGEAVSAFRVQDDWIDIGQKDALEAAREGLV